MADINADSSGGTTDFNIQKPKAKNGVTDPTGGTPNFNIQDIFSSYGYEASQAEIDALAPAFQTGKDVSETGRDAVATYVQAHQQLKGAQSEIKGNLLSEQQASSTYQSLSKTLAESGQEAYEKAADVFTKAPQLFGSLSPDQIDQYLKPTKNAFDYGMGQVEGSAAQRGITGSSLEAQAMAQAQTQFQQNVLNQGLGIGMNQQQQQAQMLQSLGSARMGLSGQFAGTGANYAGLANQSAGQDTAVSSVMAGLAGQSVNQALAQRAIVQMMTPASGHLGLGGWAGLIGGGLLGVAGDPLNPMKGFGNGAQMGGAINSTASGNQMSGQIGQEMGTWGNTTQSPLDYYQKIGGSGGGGGGGGGAGGLMSSVGGLAGMAAMA